MAGPMDSEEEVSDLSTPPESEADPSAPPEQVSGDESFSERWSSPVPGEDGDENAEQQRPTKRRRLEDNSTGHKQSSSFQGEATNGDGEEQWPEDDVSSDSTGSVPGSPSTSQMKGVGEPQDEPSLAAELQRACLWEGCTVGTLSDQDALVKHVHDVHIGTTKKAKYTCEWIDCKAKGKTQLSAYALRAHMRSHTKEKPFYCALPECDRSFTRSDALQKHMRTVHAVDGDPSKNRDFILDSRVNGLSKGVNGIGSSSRVASPSIQDKPPTKLKLTFGSSNKAASAATPPPDSAASPPQSPLSPSSRDALLGGFPPDFRFSPEELAMPRDELYALLRRQVTWANDENRDLTAEVAVLEVEYKDEWLSKELVLENVLEAEFARANRRGVLDFEARDGVNDEINGDAGTKDGTKAENHSIKKGTKQSLVQADAGSKKPKSTMSEVVETVRRDALTASQLPLAGGIERPWYRDPEKMSLRLKSAPLRAVAKTVANGKVENEDAGQDEDETEEDA